MSRLQQFLFLLCAGALNVAAFAPLGWFPLCFISLACLFHCWLKSETPRQAAWQGFVWGLGCFLGGVSWVYVSMHVVGGMPAPVAALMTLVLCAGLALFPALSGWLAVRLRSGATLNLFLIAASWALGEWLRGTVGTGFPWLSVGYTQTPPSPLAGYAPLLGVYGVSFVTVLIAAALAQLYLLRRAVPALLAICVLLPVGGFGLRMLHWTQPQGEPVTVSLLQGNIAQSLKWEPEQLGVSLQTYATLAHEHPASLVVLPETAIPLMFNEIPKDYLKSLTGSSSHVIVGAAVPVQEQGKPEGYANGAILVTPQLEASGYFKQHLVPFGEFVPSGFRWFLDLMRIPMSDFTAGPAQQKALVLGEQRIAMNICYEDLFGEELIQGVPQATLLINVSNTAWFGDSLAQPQHLQISQMRALETGRMMLRSTNTGMTAAVNADGTVAAVLPAFTRGGLTVSAQGYTGLTPYVIAGNATILLVALIIVGVAIRARRKLPQ
jgi:apolipoprotein N-acyltransferase